MLCCGNSLAETVVSPVLKQSSILSSGCSIVGWPGPHLSPTSSGTKSRSSNIRVLIHLNLGSTEVAFTSSCPSKVSERTPDIGLYKYPNKFRHFGVSLANEQVPLFYSFYKWRLFIYILSRRCIHNHLIFITFNINIYPLFYKISYETNLDFGGRTRLSSNLLWMLQSSWYLTGFPIICLTFNNQVTLLHSFDFHIQFKFQIWLYVALRSSSVRPLRGRGRFESRQELRHLDHFSLNKALSVRSLR